ncbi:hypothetical protein ALP30_02695, partial [Pseudomonas syringae pv. primulae]
LRLARESAGSNAPFFGACTGPFASKLAPTSTAFPRSPTLWSLLHTHISWERACSRIGQCSDLVN